MMKLVCALFGCPRPQVALLNTDSESEIRFAVEKRCRRCGHAYGEEEIGYCVAIARAEEHIRRRRIRIAKEAERL